MPGRVRRFALFVAPVTVLLATVIKQEIPAIASTHSFILFFLAVTGSAWIGGRAQGFIATGLVAIVVPVLSLRGEGTIENEVWLRVAFFVVEGVLVTLLIARLQREHEESTRSGEMLGNLIENVPSAIVATEPDGSIFLFNEAAERLTGYRRSEVVGKSLLDLFVPPEWRQEVAERFADPDSPRVREPHRNPWRTKSGDERLIEWRCAALPAPNGKRILGVGVDVTDLRRVEEERAALMVAEQEARERAEEANRAKDRFMGMISHELRAPLTAILGWAQLIARTEGDPELSAQGLAAIEENARAQARLVDELLDYTRIAAGRVTLERKKVPVSKIVRSVVDAFAPEAQRKQLMIRSEIETDDIIVEGDEARLRQVFMNILQNAIRYTDAGSIDVRAGRENGRIVISITDTGRGIDRDFLPHIFDRFTQGSPASDSSKGVGLGLAIVKELVALHGGNVEAESDGPGRGARFSVRLPVAS